MTSKASRAELHEQIVEVIPNLRAFARSLASNPAQADDLVQGALTRALGNLDKFAWVGGFSGVPGGNGGPVIKPKTDFNGVMADANAFNKRMKLVWIGTGTVEPESMYKGMQGFRKHERYKKAC